MQGDERQKTLSFFLSFFLSLLRVFGQSGRFCECCAAFFYAVFAELWPCSIEASGAENLELQTYLYVFPPDLFNCKTSKVK